MIFFLAYRTQAIGPSEVTVIVWHPLSSINLSHLNYFLNSGPNRFEQKWYFNGPQYFILSSSKELTSWVKLQVEIFCKASRRRALQKICTCSLTHDVSSLEDDNVFCLLFSVFLVFVFYIVVCIAILVHLLYNK